jgi:hypothetical protein
VHICDRIIAACYIDARLQNVMNDGRRHKTLRALVTKGRGIASKLRSSELGEISEKFGLKFVQGSLNLVSREPLWLDTQKCFFISGTHCYWHARLNGIPIVLNRWIGGCPVHVFEIFSEAHLRSLFNLADGDQVRLEIPLDCVHAPSNNTRLNRVLWYLAWLGRERCFYADGWYLNLVSHSQFRPFLRRTYQTFNAGG